MHRRNVLTCFTAAAGLVGSALPAIAGGTTLTLLDAPFAYDVMIDSTGRTLVLTSDDSVADSVAIYDHGTGTYEIIGTGVGRRFGADGEVVAGSGPGTLAYAGAARWTRSPFGWEEFDPGCGSDSTGYDVSADGSTVVGWSGCAGAFMWTPGGGMTQLQILANGFNRASVISDDGQWIAGFAQGTSGRTPAIWSAADQTGSLLDIDALGEFHAINPDGTVLAGRYLDGSMGGFEPFRWTQANGVEIIGSLPTHPGGHIYDMSADGNTLVGTSGIPIEGRAAMIWRPSWGPTNLRDKLIELGVTNLGTFLPEVITAVSTDGNTLVGYGFASEQGTAEGIPVTGYRAFLVTLADAPDDCLTDTIVLNTGVDHVGGTVLPIGASEPFWTVISDPDPGTNEPRPATVINPNPAWQAAEPNSQWMSSYPTASDDLNGAYVFETCFCLEEGFADARLSLGARADDRVWIYLNEDLVDVLDDATTPLVIGDVYSAATMNFYTIDDQSLFVTGRNCLQVRVQNIGSVAMGVNMVGTLTASGLTIERPECCNPEGSITGQKWNDLNGDGTWDNGEPAMAGWQIDLLDDGGNAVASSITDSNGYYYFQGVAPGSYDLIEQQQTGWTQTFPVDGVHQVDVDVTQALSGLDFGNQESLCVDVETSDVLCVVDPITGPTGDYDVTLTVTNNSGIDARYILLPDAITSPDFIALSAALPGDGSSTTVRITLTGVTPLEEACFMMVLADANVDECCAGEEVCVTVPECDCLQATNAELSCDPETGVVAMEFDLTNLTAEDVEHVYVLTPLAPAIGSEIEIPESYFDIPTLLPYQTAHIGPVLLENATPNLDVDLRITMHVETFEECCSEVLPITTPQCASEATLPDTGCDGDLDDDGQVGFSDLTALLAAWGPAPTVDLDNDGFVGFSDLTKLLAVWGPCTN